MKKVAIYSRKSKFTGKGDSIENQIETCKEYAAQHYENAEYIIYEDEGFSGGSTKRPEFLKMMDDAESRKFDILMCYRLNRVSRNVADFSGFIETLSSKDIAFVSVREQFDTASPMGRAMMYIASVFAQLERETIAEQVKDNMMHLAASGRWLGGSPPLGFESERVAFIDEKYKERTLVKLKPVETELKRVEFIYDKYLELGSVHQVRKLLMNSEIRTKNGFYYSMHTLGNILRNPAYVRANIEVAEYLEGKGIEVAGKERLNNKRAILTYNKENRKKGKKNNHSEWIAAVAKHNGQMQADKWLAVQRQLDKNSMKHPRTGTSEQALLSGLMRCAKCGSGMRIDYGQKRQDGAVPHYYSCKMRKMSASVKCQNPNAHGLDTDNAVVNKLLELATSNKETLLAELELLQREDKLSGRDILTELKDKKSTLLSEINNLVSEVSKSAAASKYILPQIEDRDRKVKQLDAEISQLEKERGERKKEADSINIVINNVLNFSSVVERLSNREKKNFIKTIVDCVYWDGEKGEVSIKLLTDINKSSHFHPPPRSDRDENTIILQQDVDPLEKYRSYPEDTLGQRIQKQRHLRGLTGTELAKACGITAQSICTYETDRGKPFYSIMGKLCTALEMPIEYFQDDYYSFVLSNDYTAYLKKWRKENTKRGTDIERILGISYRAYLQWTKGDHMSRESFDKVKDKLFRE